MSSESVVVVSRRLVAKGISLPRSTFTHVLPDAHRQSRPSSVYTQRDAAFRSMAFRSSSHLPSIYTGMGVVTSYPLHASLLSSSSSTTFSFSSDSRKWESEHHDDENRAEDPAGQSNDGSEARVATSTKSPFASAVASRPKTLKKKKKKYIPNKAAIALTPNARKTLKFLLEHAPSSSDRAVAGIMLKYQQAQSGEPRMVFRLDFVSSPEVDEEDEGVSLEVLEDGVTPKTPKESWEDGLAKLYVHHGAFLKVLGTTLDIHVDTKTGTFTPILTDRDGNQVDPNF